MEYTLEAALAKISDAKLPDFLGRPITSVHARSSFGDTPLHIAAIWGDVDLAQTFIVAGADLNARGEGDYTPLHYAIEQEKISMAKFLIGAGADLSLRDRVGNNAFDACARNANLEIRALLAK